MSEASSILDGQVALITGASKRIGAQIARTLHHAGMNLCLHYRSSEEQAITLASELEKQRPDSVQLVAADLLDTDHLPDIVNTVIERWGRLDLLVNNASGFYPTPVGEITKTHWEGLMGANLEAPLFLSQAAAPALKDSQGSIINIIDIHAERPMRQHVVYSVAKAGLLALTKSLAGELGPGIRVNGVAPGAILWPENESDTAESDSLHEAILSRTALKRPGSPDDIANAVLFLHRDAPYVTGHMLPVDGGRLLNI